MKLATFAMSDGQQHVGVILAGEKRIADLTAADPVVFASMLALIDAGEQGLGRARELAANPRVVHDLASVTLLAPIPVPRRIRDFLCFEKHFRQSLANRHLFGFAAERQDPAKVQLPPVWYKKPIYYKGNPYSVIGTGAEVHWPKYSRVIDYELEIGLVTGKKGKDIAAQEADAYIFGYTIFNDYSARDAQYIEMSGGIGPGKGKDFDTGNALGPWIVTADELGDPQTLDMITRVNGEEWSRGNSGEMHHKFRDVIAYVSQDETMYPGEILASGTVGGGCGNELGRFLKHGDEIELEVSRIGILRNRIVAPHVPTPPQFPIDIRI